MPNKNKKHYRTVGKLPPEIWGEVRAQAFKEGKFVYEWITEAIVEKLKREKEKE